MLLLIVRLHSHSFNFTAKVSLLKATSLTNATPKVQTILVLGIIVLGGFCVCSGSKPASVTAAASTHAISAAPTVQKDANWAGYIAASNLQKPQPDVARFLQFTNAVE